MINRREFLKTATAGAAWMSFTRALSAQQTARPNILWIIAEDASPHLSCYGETTIETPNIDRLASEGMRFTNAFVTSPVCSPIRSSLVTGMYQSVIGAHNHRSQRKEGKGAGNPEYLPSYTLPDPIQLIPEYFQDAGYFTVNGGPQNSNFGDVQLGKADYNFVWDISVYDSDDWSDRRNGQPFFAQIQLKGGKKRNAKVNNPVNPEDVTLPPYYPDHPVTRKDWAEYLNSMISMDEDVGEILERLEKEGLADNTMVVFMTDHGVSHLRGKQFLYDEGIHVPLIIRWPGKISPGRVNEDLVLQIDLAPTSLKAAGIPVPQHLQGLDLFDENITPREHIVATRHRCDETIENMRCVRTNRYKYIRNYYPNRPHLQPNRYKDGKEPTQLYRQLYAEGNLTELQATM
ncbi:MAG: sulfatase-like hydrolase/transferase, partial [Candidatus Marinimicrobia bacterium]|nr:sulfatase-like hydrolase/transferase [Candidatus Neomarinimicrobiota bacterium]